MDAFDAEYQEIPIKRKLIGRIDIEVDDGGWIFYTGNLLDEDGKPVQRQEQRFDVESLSMNRWPERSIVRMEDIVGQIIKPYLNCEER